jgi:RNA recognition motif-containing protein
MEFLDKLVVSNLPADTTATELRELFANYGNVVDVKITRFYAIVEFEEPRTAEIAWNYTATLRGRTLRLKPASW